MWINNSVAKTVKKITYHVAINDIAAAQFSFVYYPHYLTY